MDLNLDKMAAAHFEGEGEQFISIDLNDYREFVSAHSIVRSSHIVAERGDMQTVIPRVHEAFAGIVAGCDFFVSIRIREGISCSYEEVMDLLHALRQGCPSNGSSIQWGLTIHARMEEDIRVFILAGEVTGSPR